jgi:hypothetical protein
MSHLPGSSSRGFWMTGLALVAFSVSGPAARADVSISAAATRNIACTAGVCTPTAKIAVLNVTDLQTMLASSNVTVTTDGKKAADIRVGAPIGWVSGFGLTLDAYHAITVDKPISDSGPGSLSLLTDDGGTGGVLLFGAKGNVTFLGTANALTINGASFTLETDIASLASAIAANPSGDFALINDYDASIDGTYSSSPIPTLFSGTFDGLGHTISDLSISTTKGKYIGLFSQTGEGGNINHLSLAHARVQAPQKDAVAGGIVGLSSGFGLLLGDHVSGHITGGNGGFAGGIAGGGGTIEYSSSSASASATVAGSLSGGQSIIFNCYATGNVSVTGSAAVGGGLAAGPDTVFNSYATGTTEADANSMNVQIGGLVGAVSDTNGGKAMGNSYATGGVISKAPAGTAVNIGGLIGGGGGGVDTSYSIGHVQANAGATMGGLVGFVQQGAGSFTASDWDTDTSGITNLSQGAGFPLNQPGIAGLTTAQFQSGLPAGFDPTVWAEDPAINNGLPYLIDNPPR